MYRTIQRAAPGIWGAATEEKAAPQLPLRKVRKSHDAERIFLGRGDRVYWRKLSLYFWVMPASFNHIAIIAFSIVNTDDIAAIWAFMLFNLMFNESIQPHPPDLTKVLNQTCIKILPIAFIHM